MRAIVLWSPQSAAFLYRGDGERRRCPVEGFRYCRAHWKNRKLGGKKVRGSTLDKIPGVGDKRRTDLLKHFGSIENIKQASEQELARILPRNAAQSVYEFFHNE